MSNRRHFLQSLTSTAFLAAAGASTAQEAAKPARKLRKAIMGGTLGIKGTLIEKYKAAKEAGYDRVEPQGGMNQQEVLDALGQSGLQAASVCCHTHWKQTLTHNDAAIREQGLQGVLQTLRDAKAYGADSILVVPGVVNEEVNYQAAWERSITELKKAVPLAKELGVKISIENVWNNFLLSPLEAARYVDELQSPSVGWHLDCGNIIHYGWAQHWVQALGKRIATLHIKEYSRSKADKQGKWAGFDAEFLKGDNEWPAIMKALDDIGYDGWGIAEQPGAGSPEGLQKLSKEMDQIFAL